jgi:hypothetical protein
MPVSISKITEIRRTLSSVRIEKNKLNGNQNMTGMYLAENLFKVSGFFHSPFFEHITNIFGTKEDPTKKSKIKSQKSEKWKNLLS